MAFTQAEQDHRGACESMPRSSDAVERRGEPDPDDLYPEDVTGVLLGFAGILALVVVLAVAASVSLAAAVFRHL
jgi:hypothetical protein